MDGWMDGVSLQGAAPLDTGTLALLAYRPGQLGLLLLLSCGVV